MKINKKKLMQSFLIFQFLILLTFVYIRKYDINYNNVIVLITFIINGIIIILNISIDQREYSLNKTFWYFNFFFFFIAPLFQYLSKFKMWDFSISDNLYIKTNLYVTLCYFSYFITGFLSKKIRKKNSLSMTNVDSTNLSSSDNKSDFVCSSKIQTILLALSVLSFLFLAFNISLKGLFSRELNSLSIGDATISVILENLFRSIPIYAFLYNIYYYKIKKSGLFYIILELALLILVNFPTSITRYWVGLVYIGIFIAFFDKKINKRKFDICLIIIFAVIFPIFQLFKWYSISDLLNGANVSKRLFEVYNSVDFDAYSMFSRSINFVEKNGIEFGHQLLASIFFLVPRSIWPAKPNPTGQFIATQENQFYTNLSCPIFGEGFIDFGIIGAIGYSIILSYFITKLDNNFWKKNGQNISIINFVYPFLFGILIFMLRGSLQPVVVYTFTFFAFLFVIKKICFRKKV